MNNELRAAVTGWCDPRRVRVLRDQVAADLWEPSRLEAARRDTGDLAGRQAAVLAAASGQWAVLPPLLRDLQAAVVPSGETRGGGRGSGGGPDWSAVEILDGLRVAVADWTGVAGLGRRPDLAGGMRQLAVHGWDDDGEKPRMLARVLDHLRRRAEQLLTPDEIAPVRYVRRDCPQCGYREVLTTVDGESVLGFALVVEFHRGFVNSLSCQVCWAYWTRGQLADWAAGLAAVSA